jgi:serine/threonine protein phosphatase PrpC
MLAQSELPNGRAAAYHDNSCHGEDAYVSRELNHQVVLDAVLDGATGRGGGDASAYVASLLRAEALETVDGLTTLLEIANERLFQRGRGRFFLTTASVALKIGSQLHVVSIGDSPVFLVRDRDIVPLTPTASGRSFQGMTTVLGHRERLSYRVTSTDLRAGDRLVLASDGFIENIAPSELVALLEHASSPEAAVSALWQLLSEKKRLNKGRIDDGSGFRHDDATAIIRYLGRSPLPEAASSPENSELV